LETPGYIFYWSTINAFKIEYGSKIAYFEIEKNTKEYDEMIGKTCKFDFSSSRITIFKFTINMNN